MIVNIEKTDNKAEISLERSSSNFQFWNHAKNEWDIEISKDVELDLDLDFGATDAKIDLSNLKVKKLDVDFSHP